MELIDKCAVVAGASQGIGAEIARLFAKAGAAVILLARRKNPLEEVADSIRANGGAAQVYPMDVSVAGEWRELSAWMRQRGLACDVLVNNAYWRRLVPIGELTDEDWRQTMDVSLGSYFLGTREMIPFMLERGGGSIINISSLQSHTPEPNFGAYAVAKGGVDVLSKVIARDYAPSIRANTLVAGAVDTPGFAEGEEVKRELGRRLPAGRIGYASEIAETALFLASSRSSFVTGTEIIVDGGRSIT
ncbi:SDR family NAD(P)-dependent oxidoreductase [Cohnella silvisoli]|uniref:SDR family oxidoreductase n=1 Tax=Cohnella silvisoli TaxID=2873699 RepID=A0ABV1KTJ5_9BACL|nr:SDR family oxidoreductase [Cohnella silvisoli]MCD9021355.1 SDR family oxidoreductase [Cohnella silvisoli]